MANGMPSSRAQIDAMADAFSVVTSKSGRASFARSTKRRTPSYDDTVSGVNVSFVPGTVSDGTRYVSSPVIPSRSRLVTSTAIVPATTNDLIDQVHTSLEQMLGIVEHEQQLFRSQIVAERLDHGSRRLLVQRKRLRHRLRHETRIR